MPTTRFKLSLLLIILGIFTFTLLGTIFYFTYTSIEQWRQATREGSAAREVITKYHALQTSINEVKSSQHGYLIFSNPTYLVAMKRNMAKVDSICQQVALSIKKDSEEMLFFESLLEQIKVRRKLMKSTIQTYEKQNLKPLQSLSIQEEYRQTEKIILKIDVLKEAQLHKFLLIRKKLWDNSDNAVYWFPAAFGMSFLLILVTMALFIRLMQLREKVINQVKEQNLVLETTIDERTSALNNTLTELQDTHKELQNASFEQQTLLEKLKEAQNAIDLAFAATGVVVWTFDYIKGEVEWGAGKSLFFDNVTNQKTAFDYKSIEDFSKFIIAEDLPKIQQAIESSMLTGEQHRVEYRLKGPDKIYWVESRAILEYNAERVLCRMRGVLIDRTAAKQIERQLLKANVLFQSVFDSVADALFLADLQTSQIIRYNQKAVEMFEIQSDQTIIGQEGLVLLNENLKIFSQIEEIIEQIKEKGVFSQVCEFEIPSGNRFWGSSATTFTYQGRYLLTRISDVSERVRFEQQLLEQQKNLEQALKVIEKDNLRKSAELEETRKLQISMMPDKPPVSEFLNASIYTRTCTEVGGDYYDYYQHGDKSLTFVIGDATGHGLKASIVVATVKSYFQNLALLLPIGQLMAEISRGIQSLQIRAMYMGLQIFHFSHNKLIYVGAGMPTFLIYRNATKQIEKFTEIGLFLGFDTELKYHQKETNFESGDILFAFTDGLEEYFNEGRQEFGLENIIKAVQISGDKDESTEQLIERINLATESWSKGIANQDDITLLAIKSK